MNPDQQNLENIPNRHAGMNLTKFLTPIVPPPSIEKILQRAEDRKNEGQPHKLKKLKVWYIHGFLGNNNTFVDFPDHFAAAFKTDHGIPVENRIWNHPSQWNYKFTAQKLCRDFDETFDEEPGTYFILFGHSMGGLLDSLHAPRLKFLLGAVAFDSPYLGLSTWSSRDSHEFSRRELVRHPVQALVEGFAALKNTTSHAVFSAEMHVSKKKLEKRIADVEQHAQDGFLFHNFYNELVTSTATKTFIELPNNPASRSLLQYHEPIVHEGPEAQTLNVVDKHINMFDRARNSQFDVLVSGVLSVVSLAVRKIKKMDV